MPADEELVVIFAILHLVALLLGGALFALFLRSDSNPRSGPPDDEEDGGGGGNDRITDKPKTSPSGGIPLPDAEPAPVRLRPRTAGRPAPAARAPTGPRTGADAHAPARGAAVASPGQPSSASNP
jgi:hypothetical protein